MPIEVIEPHAEFDEFTIELLQLLDKIDYSGDAGLCAERFDIAEKYGYRVVFSDQPVVYH